MGLPQPVRGSLTPVSLTTPPRCRDPRTVRVVLGAHNVRTWEPTQQVFSVSAIIRHPDYQPTTHANDICLLQVSVMGSNTGCKSDRSQLLP